MEKYCFVIPSLQPGGMERVMVELIQYFSDQKSVEVHLILYGKKRDVFYPLPSSVRIYKPDWKFDSFTRTYATLKTFLYLRNQVEEINPMVILSFGEYWNSFVLLALFGLKYPIYISDRCQPGKNLGKFQEILKKVLYPRATGIIAQTGIAKNIYQQNNLNKNIQVVGNPIRELQKQTKTSQKENIILTVGRLIETKHHDRLIQIFKKLDTKGWKLVIVGGDALKQNGMERLKNLVQNEGLQDNVLLKGNVNDVESFYSKSKIFAFCSSSEGFPNVVGEAMSSGLPTVAYDCIAGPSDLIEDGKTGFLVPVFDDKQFGQKLEELIKNPSLRNAMGEAAKEKVKQFSVTEIGSKYHKIIGRAE